MKKAAIFLTAILSAAMLLSSCGDVGAENGAASGGKDDTSAGTSANDGEESAGTTENSSKPGLLKSLFGGKVGDNGKEYKNYDDYDKYGIIDGFSYSTEEDVTSTFIAYKQGDETWLLYPGNGYYNDYDPSGLCEVEPGRIYTITYDVQHRSGGEAGVSESEFLKIMSCEESDPSALFAGVISSQNIWNCRQTHNSRFPHMPYFASGQTGHRFVGVDTGDSYKVYFEDGSVRSFDEDRQVSIPFSSVEMTDGSTGIGFRVLCSKGVTDDEITDRIKAGTLTENSDILLIGSCGDRSETYYVPDCAGVDEHTVPFYESGTEPEEGFRKVITMADFERDITPEEAGVPEDVFEIARTIWYSDKTDYRRFHDGEERYPYNRGIMILGGDFIDSDILYMDDNARFCIANRESIIGHHSTDAHMNYAIFSVRQEYLDMFPQCTDNR